MTDPETPDKKLHFRTRLAHAGRAPTRSHGFVNPPLSRGSTVLYPDVQGRRDAAARRMDQHLVYGVSGNPTHWALENAVAEIEGGTRCQIVSSGLAAVTTPLLAFLSNGDHCLMPDSVYGPTRNFAGSLMKRMGIVTEFYPPEIDGAGMTALIRPNTKVVFAESPGSHTFEVQDIPAIARAAHAGGAKMMLDNTWGFHFFQPFVHGVDVSIQALTKYAGGHSDILLGGITVNSDADWTTLRTGAMALGQYASPDDCWLALRGLRTLHIRLREQMDNAMLIAHWLRGRPEVLEVLHPGLPGARGHDLWKRDFSGACSLFGAVLSPKFSVEASVAFVDALKLFGIGASWGGYESLILPTTGNITRTAGSGSFSGPIVRIHIGLEDPADLITDLEQGFAVMRAFAG
jgi:cystathionine beta-lyase